MTFFRSLTMILCMGLLSACQSGTSSDHDNIEKLVSLLEGEFDSGAHMRRDTYNNVPKENAHGWVNRSYVTVEAPDVGSPVIVTSTRYGGDKWTEDKYEFLVWTFKGDETSGGIIMSPQRLKDFEARLTDARNPNALVGIKPDNLEPGQSGAACDILWMPTDTGFSGTTDPCQVMSTTHNVMLNWIWNFKVDADGMWIDFRGEDETGKIYDATPKDDPYRLNRLHESVELATGKDILFNTRKKSEYDTAIKFLEQAVDKEPQNGAAHVALMYAYVKLNKYDDAAARLEPVTALRSTLSQSDRQWLDALKARIEEDSPREIAAWKTILEAELQNRWAWWELAAATYRTEDYKGVVDAIDQAWRVEPDERAWDATMMPYIQSKSYYRLGNYDEAIKAAEPGIRNPDARRATYYRKILGLMASGQTEDLTDLFATYHEYSKRNGTVNESFYNANLALLYFELADYENAVKHGRMGYDLSPGFYQAFALGYALTENGQAQEALDFFNDPKNDHPENLYIQAGKGWALYRLGRMNEAKTHYLKAKVLGKRKNWAVERDLKIINAALADPTLPQVEPVRWFGD